MRTLFLLLLLTSCARNSPEWVYSHSVTGSTQYDAKRLSCSHNSAFHGLELQFLKGEFGEIGYVQIEKGKIPSLPNAPDHAAALIQINGENFPYRTTLMEGGQKALLPEAMSRRILETLNEGTAVTLLFEGHASTFTPDNFSSLYPKFIK